MQFTEEQRKALIADCEQSIAIYEQHLKSWGDEWRAFNESQILRQKIALAALTAEPVKTKLKYSSVLPKFIGETNEVESVHCWIHGDTPDYATNEEAYAEAQKMAGDLYTTPPAAALKLPGWMPKTYYSVIQDGKTVMLPAEDGQWLVKTTVLEWMEEIKRLNTTAPAPDKPQ